MHSILQVDRNSVLCRTECFLKTNILYPPERFLEWHGTFPQIDRLPCGAYSCDVELALLIMTLTSLGAAQKPFRHPCAMVQGSGLPACRQLGCHSRSECARSKATSMYFGSLSVSMLRLHSPSSAARGDEPSRRKISRSGRPSFRAGGFCHFCSTTRKYMVRAYALTRGFPRGKPPEFSKIAFE